MNEYEFKLIPVKRAISAGSNLVESNIQAHVNANGLAYHPSFGNNGKWSVTHVKSGYALCDEATQFKNEAQCQAFVSRIANLCDWTQQKPEPSENTKVAIRRIATDCHAAYNYTLVF